MKRSSSLEDRVLANQRGRARLPDPEINESSLDLVIGRRSRRINWDDQSSSQVGKAGLPPLAEEH